MHKVLFHDVKIKQSKPSIWDKALKDGEINCVPCGYIGCVYMIDSYDMIYLRLQYTASSELRDDGNNT